MNEPARVGWIVDAQVDFMDPGGRLYVKHLGDAADEGCVRIVPSLERAVAWMRSNADLMVFTSDWHGMDDEEIDAVHPDPALGTYPPHCMGRSADAEERAGAEIIPSIRPRGALDLAIGASPGDARSLARQALDRKLPVRILKNRFDVFAGNPATSTLLEAWQEMLRRPLSFIVAGVARDVCVTQAVDGLQDRGYAVTALRDATWGLGLEPEDETLDRWARRGSVLTLDELT